MSIVWHFDIHGGLMNLLSFAFGALAMIAIFLAVTVVVGVLKVKAASKKLGELEEYIRGVEQALHENIAEEIRERESSIDKVYREFERINGDTEDIIDNLNRRVDVNMEEAIRRWDGNFQELERKLDNLSKESRSYTDSRFDKACNPQGNDTAGK